MHPSYNRKQPLSSILTLSSAKTVEQLEELKKQPGFDVNQRIAGGKNTLFSASFQKSNWLINNGINLKKLDNLSNNAIFYATSPEKLDLLIKNKINPYHLNMYHKSFLFYISKKMRNFIFSEDCKLDLSPIINEINNKGRTFLIDFFYKNDDCSASEAISLVNQVSKKGGDVTFKNDQKESLLYLSSRIPELFIYLLENFNFEKIDEPFFSITISSIDVQSNLLCRLLEYNNKSIDYIYENRKEEFLNMAKQIKEYPELQRHVLQLNHYLITKEKEIINKSIPSFEENNEKVKRL